jgi:tubulin polyglutamylase TTLL1
MKGYFYNKDYLRHLPVSSVKKNLSNKFLNLTNDAIIKYATDYSKFEAGNKLSYKDF